MNPSIFKAYDVRGKYPREINEKIVSEIISALILKFKIQNLKFKIVVGHDARLSSPNLYRAAINGIMNNKLRIRNKKTIIHNSKFIIQKAGLITTPMLYFLVNHFDADLGIMITASHNPKEYNGLKIVGKNAIPISGHELFKYIRKIS